MRAVLVCGWTVDRCLLTNHPPLSHLNTPQLVCVIVCEVITHYITSPHPTTAQQGCGQTAAHVYEVTAHQFSVPPLQQTSSRSTAVVPPAAHVYEVITHCHTQHTHLYPTQPPGMSTNLACVSLHSSMGNNSFLCNLLNHENTHKNTYKKDK